MPRTPTLTIHTPKGAFTRTTAAPYAYAVVWESPRAFKIYEAAKNGDRRGVWGVARSWVKDRGHAVTWHRTLAAAQKATRAYKWDGEATCLGVFVVVPPAAP